MADDSRIRIPVILRVSNQVINGTLSGSSYSNWRFRSTSEYFIENYPGGQTDHDFWSLLHSAENPIDNPHMHSIYDKVHQIARLFLDDALKAFEDGNYSDVKKIASRMTIANESQDVFYVCAPMGDNLKSYRAKYFPEDITKGEDFERFTPYHSEELTIYQVEIMPADHDAPEEKNYKFTQLYDMSIVCRLY